MAVRDSSGSYECQPLLNRMVKGVEVLDRVAHVCQLMFLQFMEDGSFFVEVDRPKFAWQRPKIDDA